MSNDDTFGGQFVAEVRRQLKMTPWNYATVQKLSYLSSSFVELIAYANPETLVRCFVDEVRRHLREMRDQGD